MFRKLLSPVILSHISIYRKRYLGLLGIGVATSYLLSEVPEADDNEKNKATNIPRSIKKGIEDRQKLPNIKNLIFQGGGSKGIAYIGALKTLESRLGNFNHIERVGGTSAGAITATLLSVGYDHKSMDELLTNKRVIDFIWDRNESFSSKIKTLVNFSLTSGKDFRNWLDKAISSKVAEIEGDENNKQKYENLTFGRLKELTNEKPEKYKQLYIVCGMFNFLNKKRSIICSTEYPDNSNLIISDAVRISISIPLLFSPTKFYYFDTQEEQRKKVDSGHGVDGGIEKENNYPIDLFDYNKYFYNPFFNESPDKEKLNPETLGFEFYNKPIITRMKKIIREVSSILKHYDMLPAWLNEGAEKRVEGSEGVDFRSIKIEKCGVKITDFNLSKTKMNELKASGSEAVNQFWDAGKMAKLRKQQEELSRRACETNKPLRDAYAKATNLQSNVDHYQIPNEYNEKLRCNIENPNQTGRKSQLEIIGISGSGKSQLALYSGHQYFEAHFLNAWKSGYGWKYSIEGNNANLPVIWFINAETENTLITSMQKLAEKLGCAAVGDKFDELYQAVSQTLKTHSNYLLIFDNLTNRKLIESCLKDIYENGMVLNTAWDKTIDDKDLDYCTIVDLDKGLSDSASEKLVQEICPRMKGFNLKPLTEKLSCLPLALTVAACYLNHKKNQSISVEQYLKLWDTQHDKLEKEQQELVQDVGGHRNLLVKKKTQEAAILVSVNMVKEHDLELLLKFCSCLASENISQGLLNNLNGGIDILKLIEHLRTYSLIQRVNWENNTLTMHRLVQEVIRRHFKKQLTLEWYSSLLNHTHKFINKGIKIEHDYYHYRDLLSHLEAIFTNIALPKEKYTSEMMQGHIDLGLLYKAVGDAGRAVQHYQEILSWIKQHKNDSGNLDLAVDFYLALGRACQGKGGPGKFEEAEGYYRDAERIYSKTGKQDQKLAEILNDLGMACHDIGGEFKKRGQPGKPYFDKALKHLERAVCIASKSPGQEVNCVRYKANLGEAYRQLGNLDDAERVILEAIEIGKKEKEGKHRSMASAYFNLGKIYLSKGKSLANREEAKVYFEKARKHFSDAVGVGESIFDRSPHLNKPPHPLVARHTDALGKAWRKLGDETKACECFQEATKILTFSRGAQEQLKAKIENHVGSCQGNAVKFKK